MGISNRKVPIPTEAWRGEVKVPELEKINETVILEISGGNYF
jgi:hypothetical protein